LLVRPKMGPIRYVGGRCIDIIMYKAKTYLEAKVKGDSSMFCKRIIRAPVCPRGDSARPHKVKAILPKLKSWLES
jgi:hypothetical protein